MATQLTPEQEQRIQAVVKAGAYPSAEEALEAAVTAVETAANWTSLGLNSGEPVEVDEAFWDRPTGED